MTSQSYHKCRCKDSKLKQTESNNEKKKAIIHSEQVEFITAKEVSTLESLLINLPY